MKRPGKGIVPWVPCKQGEKPKRVALPKRGVCYCVHKKFLGEMVLSKINSITVIDII